MRESCAIIALRQRIVQVEGGVALAVHRDLTTGHGDLDAALRGGLTEGRLHEFFAETLEDAPSMAGIAAMMALRVRGRTSIWLRTEAAERAMGQIYMPGLVELGGDPGAMIVAQLPDDRMMLRTAADIAACSGVGTLIVEFWGKAPLLTLTASRRLALAAEKSGVTLFLLRVGAEPVPSAASTRWRISAAASNAMSANAPGHSIIEVELLRRRAGASGMRWQLEWNRDERAFREPALPGAVAAPSEHRRVAAHDQELRRSA